MRKAILTLTLFAGLFSASGPTHADFMIDENRLQDDGFSRFFTERWFNWVNSHLWKWETRLDKKDVEWLRTFAKTNTRLNLKTKDGWVRSFGVGAELSNGKFAEVHLMALPLHGNSNRQSLLSLFGTKMAPQGLSEKTHLGLYIRSQAKKRSLLAYDPEKDSKHIFLYSLKGKAWEKVGEILIDVDVGATNPAVPEVLQIDQWKIKNEPNRFFYHGFTFQSQAVSPVVQQLEEKVRKGFNVRPGYVSWTDFNSMILFFP